MQTLALIQTLTRVLPQDYKDSPVAEASENSLAAAHAGMVVPCLFESNAWQLRFLMNLFAPIILFTYLLIWLKICCLKSMFSCGWFEFR